MRCSGKNRVGTGTLVCPAGRSPAAFSIASPLSRAHPAAAFDETGFSCSLSELQLLQILAELLAQFFTL
jgi:hypothetical protein